MIHKFYNQLGQEVGEYDDVIGEYHTSRDARKGELFLRKHWFEGKFINSPIALDLKILDKLIQIDCQRIDILILGVKKQSYAVSFNPSWIKQNGKIINYDRTKQGRNITHFSTQIVFDLDCGIIGGKDKQKTLK